MSDVLIGANSGHDPMPACPSPATRSCSATPSRRRSSAVSAICRAPFELQSELSLEYLMVAMSPMLEGPHHRAPQSSSHEGVPGPGDVFMIGTIFAQPERSCLCPLSAGNTRHLSRFISSSSRALLGVHHAAYPIREHPGCYAWARIRARRLPMFGTILAEYVHAMTARTSPVTRS